jgi:hypothetical protein
MSNQITITEALAELKLIDGKVQKKKEVISAYVVRSNSVVDPFGDSGGSRKVLEQEDQAVRDLLNRKVVIRRAIQRANAETSVTIGDETRTVADWLVWRREVAPTEQAYLRELHQRVVQFRQQAHNNRVSVVPAEQAPTSLSDLVVNVSERKLTSRAEQVDTVLATLDGKLSLHNATVRVTV